MRISDWSSDVCSSDLFLCPDGGRPMYGPPAFRLDDRAAAIEVMRVHPFAMLAAATGPGAVEITHLPILVDRDGEVVTLRGHVARANPMARLIADSTPQAPLHATAVFAGPQAYVSPDWYETENQVPTWNYQIGRAHV